MLVQRLGPWGGMVDARRFGGLQGPQAVLSPELKVGSGLLPVFNVGDGRSANVLHPEASNATVPETEQGGLLLGVSLVCLPSTASAVQ